MSESIRPPPFLIADNRALDFLNSIASPSGVEIEWLSNGSDLLDWLERTNMVTAMELKPFRKKNMQAKCDAVAVQARELREWFRTFVMVYAGRSIEEAAYFKLNVINQILVQATSFEQIKVVDQTQSNHSPLQLHALHRYQEPQDLLVPIAEAMAELICDINFWHVKECEGPTCTMIFNDISKSHRRRWCTMSVCGNRAKAAQHRAKIKLIDGNSK